MDTNKIKQIIELFENSKISSMDLEIDDIKIKLEKQLSSESLPTIMVPQTLPTIQEEVVKPEVQKQIGDNVLSPLVGTFYVSNTKAGKPYVEVGRQVQKGDVICIIEAMKVMNEIKVHRSGTITEIKVNDGDMVQFDQVLMIIGD